MCVLIWESFFPCSHLLPLLRGQSFCCRRFVCLSLFLPSSRNTGQLLDWFSQNCAYVGDRTGKNPFWDGFGEGRCCNSQDFSLFAITWRFCIYIFMKGWAYNKKAWIHFGIDLNKRSVKLIMISHVFWNSGLRGHVLTQKGESGQTFAFWVKSSLESILIWSMLKESHLITIDFYMFGGKSYNYLASIVRT